MARETLVVEANCSEGVGPDQKGSKKIKDFINKQAKILNLTPLIEPETHLSPLYGFSGWVPLPVGAVHVYVWDHIDEPHPPFVSVDVAINTGIDSDIKGKIIRSTVEHFKGMEGQVVHKTSAETASPDWEELAPHIVRQRLAIAGQIGEHNIQDSDINDYLRELSKKLDMTQLSKPIIHDGNAWMHWETSGTIASWSNQKREADIDIYTCKAFSPEDAINFTREKLGLTILSAKEY